MPEKGKKIRLLTDDEKFEIWKSGFLSAYDHSEPSKKTLDLFSKTFATIEHHIMDSNSLSKWIKAFLIIHLVLKFIEIGAS